MLSGSALIENPLRGCIRLMMVSAVARCSILEVSALKFEIVGGSSRGG